MRLQNEKLVERLQQIVGAAGVSVGAGEIARHSSDRSFHKASAPSVVVWPANTSEVSQIMKLANELDTPVTGYGGGSSLEGNPIPMKSGIILDMARMNKVLRLYPNDRQVAVQPGVICDALNGELGQSDLFFPAAPGSSAIATVGGMIANNAGGMHAVKYGVTGDWVMKLEVVLASGEVITVGSRSVKSVAGYDLKSLFIGSEGTLGIITEATLRLVNLPKNRLTFLVAFDELGDALAATFDIMSSGIEPAAVEFMERDYVKLVNIAQPLGWHEGPTLIIELQGWAEKFATDITAIKELCSRHHSASIEVAETAEARTVIWNGRRAARTNLKRLLPGCGVIPGDIGVPISAIPELVNTVKQIGDAHKVKTFVFGHAGDGNVHIWQVYKLDNAESLARAQAVSGEIVAAALALGGTCTGEHGVGIGKREYLAQEHPTSVPLMKDIKTLLDPKGILNPGKVFIE